MDKSSMATAEEPDERLADGEDTTGRDRMAWNLFSSWGAHFVFIIAGFVLPRLIDRHLGQAALGVWDFGWSMVSYFSLSQIGIGSSVNRYVARYRAANDLAGVRRTVSSAVCLNLAIAFVVLALTAAASWSLPLLFGNRLGGFTGEARWIVGFLGAGLAVEMAFHSFGGVMTGYHRWDLHSFLNAGFHMATVAAMAVALSAGGGLKALALTSLCGSIATELTRAALAYRVCPGLRIRRADAEWDLARSLLQFGATVSIVGLSKLVLGQTVNLLVVGYLGPAALAVLLRPLSLVRHAANLAGKFGVMFQSTASALQGSGQHAELRKLLMESSRYGACLALPMMLVVGILGGPILRIWMGSRYENSLVVAILGAGFVLPMCQQPVAHILVGMNLHGRLAFGIFGRSLLGIALGFITVVGLQWGLVGATLAIAIPTLGDGIFIPLFACRHLGIAPLQYFRRVFTGPLACAAPFALCLLATRVLLGDRPWLAIGLGGAAGALVLGPLYWRYILTTGIRQRLAAHAARALGLANPLRS